jgi:hypothetical protein
MATKEEYYELLENGMKEFQKFIENESKTDEDQNN